MKDQMDKKEKMLEELKRKYDGKENSSQSQLADKKFLVEFEMRQKLFEDQRFNNQVKTVYIEQSKCPFKPQINEYSRKLV